MEKIIEGIDYKTKLAKITMHGVVDRPGVAAEVFSALGQHGLNIEFISTSAVGRGRAEIMFAVLASEIENVIKVLELVKEKFGTREITIDRDCALITLYGSLLATTPGIAGKIFTRLADHKINIEMINASLSGLSIVVKKENIMEAVGAIRAEFGV
jgi:aspartate kinase